MLKKSVLGLVVAGLLALPVGIALADDVPVESTQTTMNQDRDQDRTRIQDPSVCGTYAGQTDDSTAPDVLGDQDRVRSQLRDQLHANEGAAEVTERVQAQQQAQEHTQLQSMDRLGEMQQADAASGERGFGYGYGLDG